MGDNKIIITAKTKEHQSIVAAKNRQQVCCIFFTLGMYFLKKIDMQKEGTIERRAMGFSIEYMLKIQEKLAHRIA